MSALAQCPLWNGTFSAFSVRQWNQKEGHITSLIVRCRQEYPKAIGRESLCLSDQIEFVGYGSGIGPYRTRIKGGYDHISWKCVYLISLHT